MNTTLYNVRWLLRREYTEHRKLIFAAAWLGVALVLIDIVYLATVNLHGVDGFKLSHDNQGWALKLEQHSAFGTGHLRSDDMSELVHAITFMMSGTLGLFALALGASIVSYGLSCLFDERRDRSILFWKSMPVSDIQTVAAKFLFGLILLPLTWAMCGLVTSWLLIASAFGALAWAHADVSAIYMHSQFFTLTLLVVFSLPVYLLTLFPGLSWMMLCSATARRHPALIAFIVPAFFLVLGAMGWTNPVWNLLIGRLFPTGLVSGLRAEATPGSSWASIVSPVLSPLADPQLWLGVAVGVLCLAGATYYRRRYTVLV